MDRTDARLRPVLGPARTSTAAIGFLLGLEHVYSLAAIAALAGAAGTHRSRWYVTSAFTTVVVFLLLLYSDPDDAASRFSERPLETLLGVGVAYALGLGLPGLTERLRRPARSHRGESDGAAAWWGTETNGRCRRAADLMRSCPCFA